VATINRFSSDNSELLDQVLLTVYRQSLFGSSCRTNLNRLRGDLLIPRGKIVWALNQLVKAGLVQRHSTTESQLVAQGVQKTATLYWMTEPGLDTAKKVYWARNTSSNSN